MSNNTRIIDNIHPASIFYKKYNMQDQNIHPALIVEITSTKKYIDIKNYYTALLRISILQQCDHNTYI